MHPYALSKGYQLPSDVGGPDGEPIMADRQIRIIDNPQHALHEKFGIGITNDRGTLLANFLERGKLYLMITFFQKNEQRKWTWKSPNGNTKNEIDSIICKQKHIIQDVDVINQLMIRYKVFIDVKLERARRMRRIATKINGEQLKDEDESYKNNLATTFLKTQDSQVNP
ncbi:hypothetical protein HUJ04_011174 [Dendroctonus ponderosae]|nr:hypothetical protein HUJ04_011174 [Dendroctonus ponderosae]